MQWSRDPGSPHFSAEEVLEFNLPSLIDAIPLRLDSSFVPGQLSVCWQEWEKVTRDHPLRDRVLSWVQEGINVRDFFVHFKGSFRGTLYDSAAPPPFYQPNLPSCKDAGQFIASTIEERIRNGSIVLLGRVGECTYPQIIMPLTIEPSKPRMCHDERFLNLWCKDSPFALDTLKSIPKLVEGSHFHGATIDHKSDILLDCRLAIVSLFRAVIHFRKWITAEAEAEVENKRCQATAYAGLELSLGPETVPLSAQRPSFLIRLYSEYYWFRSLT